jgi:hypothetical protein
VTIEAQGETKLSASVSNREDWDLSGRVIN